MRCVMCVRKKKTLFKKGTSCFTWQTLYKKGTLSVNKTNVVQKRHTKTKQTLKRCTKKAPKLDRKTNVVTKRHAVCQEKHLVVQKRHTLCQQNQRCTKKARKLVRKTNVVQKRHSVYQKEASTEVKMELSSKRSMDCIRLCKCSGIAQLCLNVVAFNVRHFAVTWIEKGNALQTWDTSGVKSVSKRWIIELDSATGLMHNDKVSRKTLISMSW